MTAPPILEVAETNLAETYQALGFATQCAQALEGAGFVGCTGAFPHPICNFAIVSSGSRASVNELRAAAEGHPGFHIYVSTAVGSPAGGRMLIGAGFKLVHRLVQMASMPGGEPVPLPLQAADLLEPRRRIARFMMVQFFSRHPGWIRDRVCEATAAAQGLDLYATQQGRELIGAVMLRPNPQSIGLYNLCVAAMERGRGFGSEIVKMVQRHATVSQLPVILQCNQELEPWYERLGFQQVGSVDVFAPASSTR